MNKTKIKNILREGLKAVLMEDEVNSGSSAKFDKDYDEVQRKLEAGSSLIKQSRVMSAAGLGDPNNATDRSLFSKKVRKEKNEEGGMYMFDEKELAAVIRVLNNPPAYYSKTSK